MRWRFWLRCFCLRWCFYRSRARLHDGPHPCSRELQFSWRHFIGDSSDSLEERVPGKDWRGWRDMSMTSSAKPRVRGFGDGAGKDLASYVSTKFPVWAATFSWRSTAG